MSKRKAHNLQARMGKACGAVLRSNHVAVVNIDPSGRQGMINWRNCKNVPPSRRIADAICDYPHRWTLYLAGLCVDSAGERYMKSAEAVPNGIYKAEHLTDVIEQTYQELLATCNPNQLVGSGWIALPYQAELTEAEAFAVFEAVGGWTQQKAAA